MKYPVIIHVNSDGSEYGAIVPDFPGVFSGGTTIEECLINIQESIELFYEDIELKELPDPTNLRDVLLLEEAKDAAVMLAEIDTSFLNKKSIRVNISIPEYLISRIDKKAHACGLSRSAYMVKAALA